MRKEGKERGGKQTKQEVIDGYVMMSNEGRRREEERFTRRNLSRINTKIKLKIKQKSKVNQQK